MDQQNILIMNVSLKNYFFSFFCWVCIFITNAQTPFCEEQHQMPTEFIRDGGLSSQYRSVDEGYNARLKINLDSSFEYYCKSPLGLYLSFGKYTCIGNSIFF